MELGKCWVLAEVCGCGKCPFLAEVCGGGEVFLLKYTGVGSVGF